MIRNYLSGRDKSLGSSTETEVGIGGFRLFATVRDATDYTAQVPTQVLEDGTVATDHIINNPLAMSISGEVSDQHITLAAQPQSSTSRDSTVGKIVSLLPARTQAEAERIERIGRSATEAMDEADVRMSIRDNAFGELTPPSSVKPLRERFVDFVEAVYYGKQLVSVEAAYRTHKDMAITSLSIARDNQADVLRFELALQQVESVELAYTSVRQFYPAPSPSAAAAVQGEVDQGAQEATEDAAEAEGSRTKSLASVILGQA